MRKDYFVHTSSYVDEGCTIGRGTKVWHFSHLMAKCVLGENCNLGQNVVICPNVVIGNNAGGETGNRNIIVGNYLKMNGDCNSAVVIGVSNGLSGALRPISIGSGLTGVKLLFNSSGALRDRMDDDGRIGAPWLSNGTTSPGWGTPGVSGSFQLPAGTVTVKDGLVVSIG